MTFTQTDDAILTAMETCGGSDGSFVRGLADLCRRADPIDFLKLKTAFPELFVTYARVAGDEARRRDAAVR